MNLNLIIDVDTYYLGHINIFLLGGITHSEYVSFQKLAERKSKVVTSHEIPHLKNGLILNVL